MCEKKLLCNYEIIYYIYYVSPIKNKKYFPSIQVLRSKSYVVVSSLDAKTAFS